MTMLGGNSTEHLEIVNSEVIQRLIADKWSAFGMVSVQKNLQKFQNFKNLTKFKKMNLKFSKKNKI